MPLITQSSQLCLPRSQAEDEKRKLQDELKLLQSASNHTRMHLNELQSKLDKTIVQLNESQSRLAFLRLQFDTKQTNGIPKTDVVIFVQDQQDQPLHAHKIVLVSINTSSGCDLPERNFV